MEESKSGFQTLDEVHPEELVEGGVGIYSLIDREWSNVAAVSQQRCED
jgi:hypothetical protein